MLPELKEIAEECGKPGWDGEAALPVTEATLVYTNNFIHSLPREISNPSVSAEPDGHITLEWYRSISQVLSLSISPDGHIHYAAIFGSHKQYGTVPFSIITPPEILDFIYKAIR